MLYMAKLGPDVITEEINIDDDDSTTDTDSATETCVSVQCQKQIKGETWGLTPVMTMLLNPDCTLHKSHENLRTKCGHLGLSTQKF
jgi:hypothetical protein